MLRTILIWALAILFWPISIPAYIGWLLYRVINGGGAAKSAAADPDWLKSYEGWQCGIGSDNSFIAFDFTGKNIALGVTGNAKRYPFSDIMSVQTYRNKINQTNVQDHGTNYQWTQNYGSSSENLKATYKEEITHLSYKIFVRDPAAPVYEIVFFDGAYGREAQYLSKQIGAFDMVHGWLMMATDNKVDAPEAQAAAQ